MSIKRSDCKEICVEDAIEILLKNPSGIVERFDFKTKETKRVPGVFVKVPMCEYMDQICIDDDSDAWTLIETLGRETLYTQSDEYLSVVRVKE